MNSILVTDSTGLIQSNLALRLLESAVQHGREGDNPVWLYAATKKSDELFAHCYSKLYNNPTTGLRFFTAYGPTGRPDMANFGFTNKLLKA